jgi:Tol biopolymer transport system component/DNA-binding winged helix-turn-helix (wHTH) protein
VDQKDRASQIFQFGVYEVDLAQGELRKHGQKIKLQDRPFQLLAALLERPGQVVTREELARKLWIDTLVDFDNGLNIAAKKVREALDDDAATPRYVETLPRRGYRFIAPVQVRSLVAEPADSAKTQPPVEPAVAPRLPFLAPHPRRIYVRSAALVILLFVVVRVYWLVTSVRPARLVKAVQLTQTGHAEYDDGIATDGSRVYFTEREGGRWALAQVSVNGGNPQTQQVQIPNPDIMDISPDRSSLLVSGGSGVEGDRPLWVAPTVGGSPRRLGDVVGRAGAWSRDGSRIVFVRGSALFIVNTDGTGSRKLLDTAGIVDSIRWSPPPDHEVLRFSSWDPAGKPFGLWECGVDGRVLHRLLQNWNPGSTAADGDDRGTWAAGGEYFLFRSVRGRVYSVWAMRENRTFPRVAEGPPVQLYSTPMTFGTLAPSPDGKQVFFAGGQERRELVRYDAGHKQFVPFLPDVSARWAVFSNDAQWVAYVTLPDETLWRSRGDGSERLQLTTSMSAHQPRWSPDGTRLVFSGVSAGQGSKLYVISANGGVPEVVTSDLYSDMEAGWSPDGNSLLFARNLPSGASGQAGLYLMDLKTKKLTFLPGSESMGRPAWSPDGRHIAATNRAGSQIFLLSLETRQWTPLAAGEGLGVPFWSHDSKYVYYQEVLGGAEQPILRVEIANRRTEHMMSARQIPQPNAVGYLLVGLGPHDAPVATVIHTNSDIYALDVELP